MSMSMVPYNAKEFVSCRDCNFIFDCDIRRSDVRVESLASGCVSRLQNHPRHGMSMSCVSASQKPCPFCVLSSKALRVRLTRQRHRVVSGPGRSTRTGGHHFIRPSAPKEKGLSAASEVGGDEAGVWGTGKGRATLAGGGFGTLGLAGTSACLGGGVT